MKQKLSLLLAALILCTTFTACSTDTADKTNETSTPNAGDNVTTTAETDPAETRLYADLPDVTFDGETFKTAHWQYDTGVHMYDMDADTQNGDLINDAIYDRNVAVEEKYKVTITNEYQTLGTLTSNYKKMVQAGDHSWHAIFIRAYELPSQYNNGVLINLYALPHIDWTNPWWDQDSVAGLSIIGVLPGVASDINLADNGATACVMFNKNVANNANINSDEFYQYVLDGSWTIDKMYEIGKLVSADTDGNGEHNEGDLFGVLGQHDPTYMLFFGSGERYVNSDSEGVPQLVFDNERSYAVCDKIINMMNDEVNYLASSKIVDNFAADKCLFMIDRLYRTESLRNMQSDYGVLPIPKYNEEQEEYYNIVSIHNSTLMTVPKTNPQLEMTGIILEALACESRYTVIDTYYDVVLQEKLTRDAASYQMIEIIFNNRVFDIGELYKVGIFSEELLHMAAEKTAMTSKYKTFEKKMQKDLDKIVKQAEKMIEETEELELSM
ncbi:MAG: hypothetical protein IJA85_01805 [Clostridia bacterium]|nr:hypothetical protein [Clostridia bacterium]